MRFDKIEHYMTGVLVPVSSLRSGKSSGTGEFADLKTLADWCVSAGLDLIQVLPVNDSGGQSSPYSALSAFALHPLYLRLADVPESAELNKTLTARIRKLRKTYEDEPRLQYDAVLNEKLYLARAIFDAHEQSIRKNEDLTSWITDNPWVIEYAVFRNLKDAHEQRSWLEWTDLRDPGERDIQSRWKEGSSDVYFYAWLQWRLEQQLADAAQYLDSKGIKLKGDLPILMNEDSVDVWAHRDIFSVDRRAGAPPDGFSPTGQNWGFPVYDWEALASSNYDWWRRRLLQADKFYHAYRIDHVLGFFRMWQIPAGNFSGALGFYYPADYISRTELHNRGFDDGRIRWLAEPHVHGGHLRYVFGDDAATQIPRLFDQVGDEDLYRFSADITGEQSIATLGLKEPLREEMLRLYRDRAFVQVGPDQFAATWTYRDCSRYESLSGEEKHTLEELVNYKMGSSEAAWRELGTRLLGFMKDSVPMLPCAEDLGAVPDLVLEVLGSLGILGLRIPRWERRWHEPGQPFTHIADYDFLSVCAPSVHDTSTLRQWWNEDHDIARFWETLGFMDPCPQTLTASTARRVVTELMKVRSAILVLPLQDLFALQDELRVDDPDFERVNVPGTMSERNWTYRIHVTMEDMGDEFSTLIRDTVQTRRNARLQ